MLLQHKLLGAALLAAAVTLSACSDGDGGGITARGPRTASAAEVQPSMSKGMNHDKQVLWGPAPPIFPPGAQFAVVQGDPSVAGKIFTIRLRFPNGYVLPPHTHPSDEHITVLQGTFLFGVGEDFVKRDLDPFPTTGFVTAQANMPHYAAARGITEVQVHAIGPFQLTYVHPEDDPTAKK